MIELRDYQRNGIDKLYEWFGNHEQGNPLLVYPTGAGKSVVAAALIQEILVSWPEQRILVVTHVKELIEQNFLKLLALWQSAPAGVYSASLNSRDTDSKVLFCGIQSVYNKAMHIGWADIIIVDEAHLIPKNTMSGMYRKFLDAMTAINPAIRIIGLTATPFRLDSGLLTEGEGRVFTDIAFELPITTLLDRGYLCPLTTKPVQAKTELQGVGRKNGDYIQSQLEKAVDDTDLIRRSVAEIVELGADRKSWLIFCAGVSHAQHVLDEIKSHGITADMVTGDTPKKQREIMLANFKAGAIRCMVNVSVLTTGFDAPNIDLLAFLRPTLSPGLYIQMAGRGLRTSPTKQDCLVLDFAGNIDRHGPIDNVAMPHKIKGEGGEAPTKTCPNCEASLHAAARECPECGHVFPQNASHEAVPTKKAILTSQQEPDIYPVTDVLYSRHRKDGSNDTLRVDYYSGFRRVASEWACVEHSGYAGTKARQWLAQRIEPELLREIRNYPPRSVSEVLEYANKLKKPTSITCRWSGKYQEIVAYTL